MVCLKMTFNPIEFCCKTWNAHSERDRIETMDLPLKRFFSSNLLDDFPTNKSKSIRQIFLLKFTRHVT